MIRDFVGIGQKADERVDDCRKLEEADMVFEHSRTGGEAEQHAGNC